MEMTSNVTYRLRRSLYVALTNQANSVSLMRSRGPSFAMSGDFAPLAEGVEPDASTVARAVQEAFDSAPEPFSDVVFAGAGEPLLRLRVLEAAASLIRERHAVRLRINTNGLVPASGAPDTATRLKEAGISSASVALMTADREQYHALMQPEMLRLTPGFSLQLGHKEVRGFVTACVTTGLNVECTAVGSPDVDMDATRALAQELGAGSFRGRSWHP